jgi:hypothetical protein
MFPLDDNGCELCLDDTRLKAGPIFFSPSNKMLV